MKKEYISPEMEVAVVDMDPQLVDTSLGGNATEPAHAPERDPETAQVFEGFLW